MNRMILYLSLIFFFTSCQNSYQEKKTIEPPFQIVVMDNDVLNQEIVTELKKLINVMVKYKGRDSTEGMCYTVEFYKENLNTRISEKDTGIILSYYVDGRSFDGYKGIILFVDDDPIAIVDKNNVGIDFYNESALIDYPLDKFKKVEDTLRPVGQYFKLEKGKLKRVFGGIYGEF